MASLAKARKLVKHKVLQPATFRWHRALAALERGADLPILLTTDEGAWTSDQQYAPVRHHAAILRKRLGVSVRFMTVAAALRLRPEALRSFAMVGVKLSFRTPADAAVATVRTIRERLGEHRARLVYFDGDDDLMVQWPEILQLVDSYVKKHVMRDPAAYRAGIGKSNLTDHVARTYGVSFEEHPIPAMRRDFPGVPRAAAAKIHLGWNIAFDDYIRRLTARAPPDAPRDIDVICRAGVPPDWIEPFRRPVLDALESVQTRWRVVTPRHRVSQAEYYREFQRSRICVSPFGYGELCWRDFEAILCGCLLVKPDVAHLRTHPDVFVPGETFVPVRWDYGDLLETCERYLSDDAARLRIASRAQEVLAAATRPEAFVSVFASVLQHAGVIAPGAEVEASSGAFEA